MALIMSAFVAAFSLIAGGGVFAFSILNTIMLICAMCMTWPPKSRCAGVGLNENLFSGIASAIFTSVSFWPAHSLRKSALSVPVCCANGWAAEMMTSAAAAAAGANTREVRVMGTILLVVQ